MRAEYGMQKDRDDAFKTVSAFLAAFFSFFPLAAFAQGTVHQYRTLADILATGADVLKWAVPTGGILLLFFYVMWQVIANAGDAERVKKARPKIIWGLVVLFAIFSLGGIIAVLQMTFFNKALGG